MPKPPCLTLSKRIIDRLPVDDKDAVFWDRDLPGFGIGVYPSAKDLAYCLYDICANKRRNAGEAASCNGLIARWPELTRQAAAIHDTRGDLQGSLEL